MIQDDALIHIAGGRETVSCFVEDEVVLFDSRSGLHYGLDSVGANVWKWLEEARSLHELRRRMLEHYDVEPSRCAQDLMALLDQLSQAGLVEVGSTPHQS